MSQVRRRKGDEKKSHGLESAEEDAGRGGAKKSSEGESPNGSLGKIRWQGV